ncbi:nucleotide kinase domain-containing protein [Natrinema thermotolerans]|nr:nucleotide kinase domain-containing protein [Natrinema thermotolerans]
MALHRLEEFLWFMCERQRIYERRFIDDQDPPWTDSDVLQEYHFCNVYRRLDYTTQHLLDEVLTRENDRDVFFNTVIYRFFNRPKTFQSIGGFTPVDRFDPDGMCHALRLYEEDHPLFSSAYRVTTHSWADSDSKAVNIVKGIIRDDLLANFDYYCESVLEAESMEDAFEVLCELNGVGEFLAYEMVIDLNYELLPFSENDFVNIGPGSSSGLMIIFNEVHEDWLHWMVDRQEDLFAEFDLTFPYWEKRLTLRSFEHALCEYQKFVGIKEQDEVRRKFSPRDHAQDTLEDFA